MTVKSQEIKEITIKGLEPEIERIIGKGKEEAQKVEERYLKKLEGLRAEISEEYEVKFRQFKERVAQEAECIIEKERAARTSKLSEHQEQADGQLSALRAKLRQ